MHSTQERPLLQLGEKGALGYRRIRDRGNRSKGKRWAVLKGR